jgi:transposase
VKVKIVQRSDTAKGFVVLPRRWVAGRTFAWRGRGRRLAKDREGRNRRTLAFPRWVSSRLMLRNICNPSPCSRIVSQ